MNRLLNYKWWITVIVVTLVIIMSHFLVNKLLYPVPWLNVPSPPPSHYREVFIDIDNGKKVHGWYIRKEHELPLMIYFHGNGENLETLWISGLLKKIMEMNVNFLAIDYPGYGNSGGKPSETAIIQSAQKALEWGRQSFNPRGIILCGWSLGAAVAIQLAAQNPSIIDALIIISPWLSLEAVAGEHYPGWLVRWLLKERYDSAIAAAQVRIPTLIIHGSTDNIIPVSQGKELMSKFPQPPQFYEISGAGHNDLFSDSRLWQGISAVISAVTRDTTDQKMFMLKP